MSDGVWLRQLKQWVTRCIVCVSLAFNAAAGLADDVDFERDIRPLLQRRCVECHGPTSQKNGLRLDAKSFALKGGDGGPVVVANKPDHSELLRRIASNDPDIQMPPDGGRLTQAEIESLRRWIEHGAIWPETDYDRNATIDTRLNHWAWQPVTNPTVPKLPESAGLGSRSRNEIDHFIAAKLSEHGLTLSNEADRATLIRRLSFDLLGLPPMPEQVEHFVTDSDPHAYEKLVNSMLASPAYGERWARHWLDIAHYADTHGFERDQRRDNAWRYRDWVIRAINADMPYNQFVKDQIAGDALRPDDPEAVAATGFLAAGPWDFVGQAETPSPVLKRLARADDLDDMVTQVMTSTCAVTVNCARCHDHKLDPISQREYYSLWAVFAGVKRGERVLSSKEQTELTQRKAGLEQQLMAARSELAALRRDGWSLADVVGGGDGHGSGKPSQAIDPVLGDSTNDKRGLLKNAPINTFVESPAKFIDGVVIPDGGTTGDVVITSTGIVAHGVPNTSGKAWDAIRNGAVNSQFSTELGGIDFATEPHSLLSLHANSAITFDLAEMRKSGLPDSLKFTSQVGYFGQIPTAGASFHVFLDGVPAVEKLAIGRDDGLIDIDVVITPSVRFLTLMATDNGNDISHDQICFANAQLELISIMPDDSQQQIAALGAKVKSLQEQIAAIPEAARIYATISEAAPAIHVQLRGNPEQPGDEVTPGAIACVKSLPATFGANDLPEAQRRMALADWITSDDNPLVRRVIMNRLWHHHFGKGLVDTPSDFGLGGSLPSHPELLDWLATRLRKEEWSLKSMHRLICTSAVYRQTSSTPSAAAGTNAHQIDSDNRLLWRQNARRLDAESLRDAVLAVSGKLNPEMFGPGYRDFDYKEEYAPVYSYITADNPELWKRSVYRFVVRTTPDQFLATLDCPNAANMTPSRNVTTTSLQALALLNNEFMLKQATYFAERVALEAGELQTLQIQRTFQLAFGRNPSDSEVTAAKTLLQQRTIAELCRACFNANEFVFVD